MSAIASLDERRRDAALRMAASGAPFAKVVARYGWACATYARAVLWEAAGKDQSDEGGMVCWLNVFGPGDEPLNEELAALAPPEDCE